MNQDDNNCPIRRQVIPYIKEKENRYGMPDYLIWKKNRLQNYKGQFTTIPNIQE
jgi:L-lysine 2,3-aminomutase